MSFWCFDCEEGSVFSAGDLEKVCSHLANGRIALLPTETGYLLGVDGTNTLAVEKLFQAKGRSTDHSVSLAVADFTMACRFGELTPLAEALLSKWSPGPLTIVVTKREENLSPSLSNESTIGLRIPDHRFTLEVLRKLNRPITATSANRSGSTPKQRLLEIVEELSPYIEDDWIGAKDDSRKYDQPSTIVRIQEGLEVLREGPILKEAILKEAKASGLS
jgi:L-threonylcarbamoyladenylate synthase